MKKILLVGLVFGSFQLSFALSRSVNDITPHVKKAVLKACDNVYEVHPEFKDELFDSLSMQEHSYASVLEIAKPYDINMRSRCKKIQITEQGKALYTNEYIQAMNTSLKVIREARKNRPPQQSSLLDFADTILSELSHDPQMSRGEEKIYKQMERNREEAKRDSHLLAYQANPNKISSATDEGLQICRNAMIDTNYKLNPTWDSWAYTQGLNGTLMPSISTAAVLAGLALGVRAMSKSGEDRNNNAAVGGALAAAGAIGIGLSFNTDNLQFEIVLK